MKKKILFEIRTLPKLQDATAGCCSSLPFEGGVLKKDTLLIECCLKKPPFSCISL
tara:strand:+ start:168 stop:332 length:165 start_codon:yes stop_codon:yes gene_type:complete